MPRHFDPPRGRRSRWWVVIAAAGEPRTTRGVPDVAADVS
jgi:hypothetical protein